jgi:hypothetical protein
MGIYYQPATITKHYQNNSINKFGSKLIKQIKNSRVGRLGGWELD